MLAAGDHQFRAGCAFMSMSHGGTQHMRIEECNPCPRCGHSPVVQRARDAYVCYQCRFGWTPGTPVTHSEVFSLRLFSAPERERLVSYRAAIRAGVYSDWPAGCA